MSYKINVTIAGTRPLMFDRYAGDNNTKLSIGDKMYLQEGGRLTMPAVNLFSLLAAENTKSVCRQFFGKSGKTIGLGIASYVSIEPFEIPLLDANGQIVFSGLNKQISAHYAVARVKGGIPNPKERPVLALPWRLEFEVTYLDNIECTMENLRTAFVKGGMLGLGTFRPYFGTYDVARWEPRSIE